VSAYGAILSRDLRERGVSGETQQLVVASGASQDPIYRHQVALFRHYAKVVLLYALSSTQQRTAPGGMALGRCHLSVHPSGTRTCSSLGELWTSGNMRPLHDDMLTHTSDPLSIRGLVSRWQPLKIIVFHRET
jgi:hypothetical protein